MWNLINIFSCFIICFVVFYIGFKIFKQFVFEKEYDDHIAKKVETFIESKSSVGGVITRRVGSAFVDKEKEKFEELLSTNNSVAEKVKLKLKEDGIRIPFGKFAILCIVIGFVVVYFLIYTKAFEMPLNSILVGMPIGSFIVYSFLSRQSETWYRRLRNLQV